MRWDQVVGAVVGGFGRDVASENPVVQHYLRYLAAMVEHALTRWGAVGAAGVRCQVGRRKPDGQDERCQAPAIGGCLVCGAAVCVSHAFISPRGALCFACADKAIASGPAAKAGQAAHDAGRPFGFVDPDAPSPVGDALRRKHLRTLGLGPDATFEQAHAAFRRLSREQHPDRAKPSQRQAKERKFKAMSEAYSWLKSEHERRTG
jgi:hypothetical protein